MTQPRLCIVGQVLIDVMRIDRDPMIRLGGIVHAARMAWAICADFEVAYVAPSYMDDLVECYLADLGAASVTKIGTVTGSPNVILVRHAEEATRQGYEYLLRDEHQLCLEPRAIERVFLDRSLTDVLLFPDETYCADLLSLIPADGARIYVDGAVGRSALATRPKSGSVHCLVASTSSRAWHQEFGSSVDALRRTANDLGSSLLFKENRGGARFFSGDDVLRAHAQPLRVAHSVGVGDAFDVAFAWARRQRSDAEALALASALAADYASTTDLNVFAERVASTLQVDVDEMAALVGVSLPWEDRASIDVYVAAPDFSDVDRAPIDAVAEALRYHNFRPRLPVREHGQLAEDASGDERLHVVSADLGLLAQCELVVAVLVFHDPGTLIEIGFASDQGQPVVVYDPFGIVENAMLREVPTAVCRSLDGVITAVFEESARLLREREGNG